MVPIGGAAATVVVGMGVVVVVEAVDDVIWCGGSSLVCILVTVSS